MHYFILPLLLILLYYENMGTTGKTDTMEKSLAQ